VRFNKSYRIRKIINNSLLFIFLLFSLNDLIDMHIRVIFNVDITSHYTIDGKTNNSPVKVKPAKKKNKPDSSGHDYNFTKPKTTAKTFFVLTDVVLLKDFLLHCSSGIIKTLIPRAPPLFK